MSALLDDRLADLLAGGRGRVVFGLLTDEEALTLDGDLPLDLVVSPFLDAHPGVDPSFVRAVGGRSLTARGLVEPREGADGELESFLTPELEVLVRARREGVGLLRARRPEPPYHSARTFVLRERLGGFEEDVNVLGMHYLSACTYAAGTDRLAAWCLGPDASPGPRARQRVETGQWARWLHAELGPGAELTCVEVIAPPLVDEPPVRELVLVAQAGPLAVVARPVGDHLEVSRTDRAALGALLLERARDALGPGS